MDQEKKLLRLKQIVPGRVPISRSSWWAGVKSGKYPKPIKLGERTTVWRSDDIDALINGGANHEHND